MGRLENLQALRFFAALAVAIYHGRALYLATGGKMQFGAVSGMGFAGVDVFFVLSGFIMWMTTANLKGPADAARFAYRRATRIYTTWWILFVCLVLWTYYWAPKRLQTYDLISSFFLIQQSHKTNIYPVTWTLSYELYFYLMLTVAILIGGRRFIFVPLLAAIGVWALSKFGYRLPKSGFLTSWMVLEFVAGFGLGWLVERRRLLHPWLWIGAGLTILVAAGLYSHFMLGIPLDNGKLRGIRVTFLLPMAVALVGGFALLEGRIRFPRWIIAMGDASYGIYLWHILVFAIIRRMLIDPVKLPPIAAEVVWIAAAAVVCVIAHLSYRFVEKPILGWLNGMWFARRTAVA